MGNMEQGYNYATKYGDRIADVLRQESLTGILETPSVNWLGDLRDAKSFVVKSLNVSGYRPHTRDLGFNPGTIEDGEDIYTLGFDRDVEFAVDRADVDETNGELSAMNVTAQFMRQQVIPEIDAYRFSKMATTAIGLSQTASETIDKTNVFDRLKASILPRRKYGASNIICYVSSEVMDAFERSEDFKRSISSEKIAEIETRVSSLDGVKLLEAWDSDRFKTSFDFSEGFKPTDNTLDINFMLVVKPAIIAKIKLSSVYLHAPGAVGRGDCWIYQNRCYHDLFVLKQMQDGVYVSTKAAG